MNLTYVLLQTHSTLERFRAEAAGEWTSGSVLQYVEVQSVLGWTGIVTTLMLTVVELKLRIRQLMTIEEMNPKKEWLMIRFST